MIFCVFSYNRPDLLVRTVMSLPKDMECIVFDNGSDRFDPKEVLSQCKRDITLYRVEKNVGIDRIFLEAVNFLKKRGSELCWFIGDDDFLIEESRFIFSKDWGEADVIIANSIGESQISIYRSHHGIKENLEFIRSTPKTFFKNFSLRMPFGSTMLNVKNLQLRRPERWIGTHHLYSGLVWDHLVEVVMDKCVFVDTPSFCRGEGQQTWTSYKREVYERIGIWFRLIPDAFRTEASAVFNEVWLQRDCPNEFRELAREAYLQGSQR